MNDREIKKKRINAIVFMTMYGLWLYLSFTVLFSLLLTGNMIFGWKAMTPAHLEGLMKATAFLSCATFGLLAFHIFLPRATMKEITKNWRAIFRPEEGKG